MFNSDVVPSKHNKEKKNLRVEEILSHFTKLAMFLK